MYFTRYKTNIKSPQHRTQKSKFTAKKHEEESVTNTEHTADSCEKWTKYYKLSILIYKKNFGSMIFKNPIGTIRILFYADN